MKSRCRTCAHAQRAEIDAALLAGEKVGGLAARHGLPRQTLQEHHRRGHCKAKQSATPETAAGRARWLVDQLQALLKKAIDEDRGDVPDLSREYRQILSQSRIWDREDAAERAAAAAAAPSRALDQPGVADMLQRLLASLSDAAAHEVVEWIQGERNATDPD